MTLNSTQLQFNFPCAANDRNALLLCGAQYLPYPYPRTTVATYSTRFPPNPYHCDILFECACCTLDINIRTYLDGIYFVPTLTAYIPHPPFARESCRRHRHLSALGFPYPTHTTRYSTRRPNCVFGSCLLSITTFPA